MIIYLLTFYLYSTTKETHQSLIRAIMVKLLRNENIFYTIFFNNHLRMKLLNNVTVLQKPCHAVRQCIDKESFLKMTSFRQLVFTQVLVLISSLRPMRQSRVCRSQNKLHKFSKPGSQYFRAVVG